MEIFMSNLSRLLYFSLLLLTISQSSFAQISQSTGFERQLKNKDDQAVKTFLESKEDVSIKEKTKYLDIGGDVRFEWNYIREKGIVLFLDSQEQIKRHYDAVRGGSHVGKEDLPISHNDFDVEANLKIKYTRDDAWAQIHLQFDNSAGIRAFQGCRGILPVFNRKGNRVRKELETRINRSGKGSGIAESIALKRAFIGYNLWTEGKSRLDVQVGRHKLDDLFDSELQFSNRFDGIALKFASNIENFSDVYINGGAFIIDERVNYFGWAAEIGFLNIYDSGLNLKYSYIDWNNKWKNRCFVRNPLGNLFKISQICFAYNFKPEVFCIELPVEIYGGALINHAAKKTVFTRHKKKNLGWYAGVFLGEVKKKGDWSFDVEYLYVQAQAVPDYDVGGIGRGNIFNLNLPDFVDPESTESSLTFQGFDPVRVSLDDDYSSSSPSNFTAYFPRQGNANFYGWRFEFLYALTNELSLDFIYQFSFAEDKRIGGPHRYNDFEIEAIYAF